MNTSGKYGLSALSQRLPSFLFFAFAIRLDPSADFFTAHDKNSADTAIGGGLGVYIRLTSVSACRAAYLLYLNT